MGEHHGHPEGALLAQEAPAGQTGAGRHKAYRWVVRVLARGVLAGILQPRHGPDSGATTGDEGCSDQQCIVASGRSGFVGAQSLDWVTRARSFPGRTISGFRSVRAIGPSRDDRYSYVAAPSGAVMGFDFKGLP